MEPSKTLKIIPWGLDNSQALIDTIPEDERDNQPFWYLHGKLEELFHYDKATAINCKTIGVSEEIEMLGRKYNAMCYNGTIDVEVEGCNEPCIGYFYMEESHLLKHKLRGLVCLKTDMEGCNYAMKKMKEKALIL